MFTASCVMPNKIETNAYTFIINSDGDLLIHDAMGSVSIPKIMDLDNSIIAYTHQMHYLGKFNDVDCMLYRIEELPKMKSDFRFINIRTLLSLLDSDMWFVAGYAKQIYDWDINFKYCGRCSTETKSLDGERAKKCKNCGLINYPRISPAMIVMVEKGKQILLAKNKHSKYGFYSVLAGFVEPGETLEECVIREVKEEVGLEIQNIRYFESQPWPMPDCLMIGFIAEYKSGEIVIDKAELSDAQWFNINELPEIPPSISIGRKLIQNKVNHSL